MKPEYDKLHVLLIYAVLVLATVIAYEPVRHNEFINYDDEAYVTKNPHVNGGITRESIIWAFTTLHGGTSYWHPLTWLSHMLDCELFGLNPLGHHLTNLIFHIANTLLLFGLLRRITGGLWPSVFVAAAFALHPAHVESVAWVAERKDVLSTFFFMLTIAAYIRYTESRSVRKYLLVVLAFSLGLMAKPMVITLPFVLLLLDFWPLGQLRWGYRCKEEKSSHPKSVKVNYQKATIWRLIGEKIPLFMLTAVLSLITYIAQQNLGATRMGGDLPLTLRVSNALVSYVSYIGKMFYPSRLAVLYPYRFGLPLWQPIICFMILVAVSVYIVFSARRRGYLVTGWLWYIGILVPVIGLLQVGAQAMANRYTYLSAIGIFIMVAWGGAELFAKWPHRKIGLGISAIIVLSALLLCTRIQVQRWKNNFTLYEYTLKVTENNFGIHNNLGIAFESENKLDEAVSHYRQALEAKPDFAKAHHNLGTVLLKKGKSDEAISHLRQALEARPDSADAKAHYNLGTVLLKKGKLDEAISYYRKAVEAKPDFADAHSNLGNVLFVMGRLDEAISHYRKALEAKPDFAEAHSNLGNALLKKGKSDEAIKHLRHALRIKPDLAGVHKRLGNALSAVGLTHEAVSHFRQALEIKAGYVDVEAQNNLAWILATHSDPNVRNADEAVALAEQAAKLTNYQQVLVLDTLAAAYAAGDQFDKAVTTVEAAIKLSSAAQNNKLTNQLRKRLELYKKAKPYREPGQEQGPVYP